MPAHTFAKLPVRILINDPKKNGYRHQLQPMLHFLTNQKFDLLSYFYIINFLNLPLRALIHDLQKKTIRASTRTHDPFFDNSEIWPTFIYRGEVPPDTFAKLPVHVLINDPKKNGYRHQLQPMLHFLTNQKFDLLSYFYIINFLNLPLHALIHDLQKKNIQASTRTHDPFFDNSEIWPTFIYRGEVPAHTFAKLPVCVLINDPQKNWYRHQLQPMLHFLMNQKFDLLSYFYIINFLNLPLRALIHDLQKKNIRASTRTHDPFFDNSGIWPTFIYRGEVPAHTFAKLPVRVLINDPQKNGYRHQLQPMLHFLMNHKFDLLSYFYIINFLNLPLRALIHDLQKKNLRASTRTHDPFFDNPEIWPTFIYRGEVPADTFAKLPVRALINDPKKLFQKKVYVTIPQWFETFPNVSDLWSGRNRAKCGLALNDPIDWFKLRLNQPISDDWVWLSQKVEVSSVFVCLYSQHFLAWPWDKWDADPKKLGGRGKR